MADSAPWKQTDQTVVSTIESHSHAPMLPRSPETPQETVQPEDRPPQNLGETSAPLVPDGRDSSLGRGIGLGAEAELVVLETLGIGTE